MLCYFACGSLPWQGLKAPTDKERNELLEEKKSRCSARRSQLQSASRSERRSSGLLGDKAGSVAGGGEMGRGAGVGAR